MDSVLSEYEASLADLTFNSKPHINMLTVLAEENVNYASDIVKIIENQLFQASQKRKMPVLYLIDSIVKNFGGQYMKLFSHKLVSVFMCIFEKAEGKTRGDLYKLRSTWDSIFPSLLLKELDLTVRGVDHNWPMRSKKRHRSRNPLSLGHSSMSSPKFSEEEETEMKYGNKQSNVADVEEVIEEEEIEMDDESLGVLEMLEEKLRKRQAELSRLEYLESKEVVTKTIFKSPVQKDEVKPPSDDDALKIDLNEYPVFPIENINDHPTTLDEPIEEAKPRKGSIDEDLSDTKHWLSRMSSFEPHSNKVKSHDFDGMTTNRVISHFIEPEVKQEKVKTEEEIIIKEEIITKPEAEKIESHTQTDCIETTETTTQFDMEMKDESTQYRYRRKTKNFMSQYKVPTKTIGTYFKIKSKDNSTQYEPPNTTQDTAADSTCLPLEDDLASSQVTNAQKETRTRHSLQILQSLRKQRDTGMLCDITLAAQGQHFKAHKAILASCSDFFHTLFASEALKQSPLSYIELQGITASALNLVLEYIYTSEVSVDGSVKSVHEIITAAKRLKISSLFSACSVLEEAIASDQDLTGWVISNTELVAPNPNVTQDSTLGSSGLVVNQSNESLQRRFSDIVNQTESTKSSRKSSMDSNINLPEVETSNIPKMEERKLERSLSETKLEKKSKKRKDRSHSYADSIEEVKIKKRRKSDGSDKSYPCPLCKKIFWKKKLLKLHKEKSHPQLTEDEIVKAVSALKYNVETLDDDGEMKNSVTYECIECTKTFKNQSSLNSHVKKIHKSPPQRRKRMSKDKRDFVTSQKNDITIGDNGGYDQGDLPVQEITKNSDTTNGSEDVKKIDTSGIADIIHEKLSSGENPFITKQNNSNINPDDPTTVKLKLYQCDICEEIFSVQCFYKAHMAGHKRNGGHS